MRKELVFEYPSFPKALKVFEKFCQKLGIDYVKEDAGGTLITSTQDQTLRARMVTEQMPRGDFKILVYIRVYKRGYMKTIRSIFGKSLRERNLGASPANFAEAVVKTKFKGDTEAFEEAVCEKLHIERSRFPMYKAMVLTTSSLPHASDLLKQAAAKLREVYPPPVEE